jgi:hypothetical protein
MNEHNLATVFAETLFRDYDDASGWQWLPDATLHHMSAAQAEAHSRQMASVHRSVDVKINLLKMLIVHANKIAVLSKHDQILSPGMYDDLPLFGDGNAAGTGGNESRVGNLLAKAGKSWFFSGSAVARRLVAVASSRLNNVHLICAL